MKTIGLFLTVLLLSGTRDALAQGAPASPAATSCIAGACFAKAVSVGGQTLPLKGVSLFEYFRIDLYSGALYITPEVSSIEGALGPVAKRLVLHYHRGLTKANFIESSEKMLAKYPEVSIESIRKELDTLYTLYTDVSPGDRYALEYVPGVGTTLYLNDVAQGTIPGDAFQKAYFSIWLSKYSVSDSFTDELLGIKN